MYDVVALGELLIDFGRTILKSKHRGYNRGWRYLLRLCSELRFMPEMEEVL